MGRRQIVLIQHNRRVDGMVKGLASYCTKKKPNKTPSKEVNQYQSKSNLFVVKQSVSSNYQPKHNQSIDQFYIIAF